MKIIKILVCVLCFLNISQAQSISFAKHLLKDETLPQDKYLAIYFNTDKPSDIVFKEEVSHADINYGYDEFHGIKAEKLVAYWGGEFNFDKNITKRLAFGLSNQQVRVIVDDKVVFEGKNSKKEEIFYTFSKGKHKIEVELMNGYFVVNFNFSLKDVFSEFSEEEVAQKIKKEFKGLDFDILLASLDRSKKFYNNETLVLEKSNKPLLLLVNSHRAINLDIQNPYNNKILAILSYNKDNNIKSKDKIYHIKNKTYEYNYEPKCDCYGSKFSCNARIKKLNEHIKEIFGKDIYGLSSAYVVKKPLNVPNLLYKDAIKRLEQALQNPKNCAKKKVDFANIFKAPVTKYSSWAKELLKGEVLPKDEFLAIYFNKDNPNKIAFKEIVKNVNINDREENFGIKDSEKFVAYWGGVFEFKKDVSKEFMFNSGGKKVRIFVDDKIIYEGKKRGALTYDFTKGEHKIEIEFINLWHSTEFSLKMIDILEWHSENEVAADIKKEFGDVDFDLVLASVYGSKEVHNKVTLKLEKFKKPVVLLLGSLRDVDYVLQNPYNNKILAVLVYGMSNFISGDYKVYFIDKDLHAYDYAPKCSCTGGVFYCGSGKGIVGQNGYFKKLFGKDLYAFSTKYRVVELKVPQRLYNKEVIDEIASIEQKHKKLKQVCTKNLTSDFKDMFKQ